MTVARDHLWRNDSGNRSCWGVMSVRHEASLCGKDSGKRSICAEIPVARDHLCAGMTEEETTVCWNDRETRGFVLRVEITLCGENSRTYVQYSIPLHLLQPCTGSVFKRRLWLFLGKSRRKSSNWYIKWEQKSRDTASLKCKKERKTGGGVNSLAELGLERYILCTYSHTSSSSD